MEQSTMISVTVRGRRERVKEVIRVGEKNYYVLENLSSGGREIYRVFDAQGGPHGDYRALHVLPRGKDSEQRVENIRRLAQPRRSFPTVVDYFAEPDRILTVFDWAWGRDLQTMLKDIRAGKTRRFSVFEAVKRMRGLAHSLGEYHRETSLVHADVKPANIVVSERPHNFVLVDFGSAWPVERTTTRSPGDGVSRPYAAPELLVPGGAADFRADIFSHSVIFYELLTLKIPYGGLGGTARTGGRTIPALEAASAISPDRDRLPTGVWRLIDGFLARGLALSPDGRFSDRGAWLNAIDEIDLEIRSRKRLDSWSETVAGVVTRLFGKGRDKRR